MPQGGNGHLPCGPNLWSHDGAHFPPHGTFILFIQLYVCVLNKNQLYIWPLWWIREEAADTHKKHETYLHSTRIGGKMLLKPSLVAPSTPLTPSPSSPWWIGSSLSLDYEIVEVTCLNLSVVCHWLESHEIPIMTVTIFVLPLWGSFIIEMIYEMQIASCSWCSDRCIFYLVQVCFS
jgi:hypothetical protein